MTVRMGAWKCVVSPIELNLSGTPFTLGNGKYLWMLERHGFLVCPDAHSPYHVAEVRQNFAEHSSSHLLCVLTQGQMLLGPHTTTASLHLPGQMTLCMDRKPNVCSRRDAGKESNSISLTSQGPGRRGIPLPGSSLWCGH